MEPGFQTDQEVEVQAPTPSKHPKRVIWVLALLTALVLLAVVPVIALSVSPMSCERCHDEAEFLKATEASSHADVDCVSCHAGTDVLSRIDFGFRQTYAMAIPIFSDSSRDGAVAYNSRCITCHEDLTGVINRDGINIAHETCSIGSTCTDCHGGVAHGISTDVWVSSYSMDGCLECHAASEVRRDCTTCHEGRREADRTLKGAWSVTHGPDWERTHGMGNLATCTACHEESVCAKCHGVGVPHGVNFSNEHGTVSQSAEANCSSCHRTEFCTDCHGDFQMPHPVEFTKTHSQLVDSDGSTACLNCHTQQDCDNCHAAHVHPGGSIGKGGGL